MGMTPADFESLFELQRPRTPPKGCRTLIHLGLPGPHELVVWYGRPSVMQKPHDIAVAVAREDGRPLVPPAAQMLPQPFAGLPVGRIRVTGLSPNARYRLEVGSVGGSPRKVTARTAPAASSRDPFSFIAFSCFSPFSKNGDAVMKRRNVHSLRLLHERSIAPQPAGPSFLVAMGDQVYVDEGAFDGRFLFRPNPRALLGGAHSQHRLYNGRADDFFTILYRQHLGLPLLDDALAALPSVMMWDDHDIRDGWGSQRDEDCKPDGAYTWQGHLDGARRHFLAYQMLRNPAPLRFPEAAAASGATWDVLLDEMLASGAAPTDRPDLHFTFEWGAAVRFFVMDLRSQRRSGGSDGPRVISEHQYEAVKHWLEQRKSSDRPRLYVIVTALPLTHQAGSPWAPEWWLPMRRDDRRDNWWSKRNKTERDRLLEVIYRHFSRHENDRLLVLSGDVHFAELMTLRLKDASGHTRVFGHEVVASGLAVPKFYTHRRIPLAPRGRLTPQQRAAFLEGRLHSIGWGARLFAPHFVEIFVDPSDEGRAPAVKVLYVPAADREGKHGHLVNPIRTLPALVSGAGDGLGPLPLLLDEPPEARKDLFDRFMMRSEVSAPCWNEDARDWAGYE